MKNTKRSSKQSLRCLIVMIHLLPIISPGDMTLLDFSGGFGVPAGNWNVIDANEALTPLMDFISGSYAGVTITTSNLNVHLQNYQSWDGGVMDWVSDPAALDMMGTMSSAAVTIGGLTGEIYRVELVSAFFRDTSGGIFSVQNDSADTTYSGIPPSSPWLGYTDGRNNWMIWNNVIPTNGEIEIYLSTTATITGISAMRITSVIPEPNSITLLLLGAGTLLLGKTRIPTITRRVFEPRDQLK